MIKKTLTYVDFNGQERTETFHFHFSETELLDMETSVDGGFSERVQRIVDAKDQGELLKILQKFVKDAYGVKSDDGRRFVKNEDVLAAFVESPAYPKIFMELLGDDKAAAEFVNGVVPADFKDRLEAMMAKQKTKALNITTN